jgi:uncharacterized repeat protein (TIGR01451 family)
MNKNSLTTLISIVCLFVLSGVSVAQADTGSVSVSVGATSIQSGSSESYSYHGTFSTVPDHYTVEIDGPNGQPIQSIQSYSLASAASSFEGHGEVAIFSNAPTGNYTVSVYYYAKGSAEWEANAMKVFRVIPAPAPPVKPIPPVEPTPPVTPPTPPVEPTPPVTPPTESVPAKVPAPLAPQSVSLPAKLALVKVAARKVVKAGQSVRFTLRVTDIGQAPATNVQVCDQVPAHTTVASAPTGSFVGGKVCYRIGTLNAGVSATRFITLRVDSDAPAIKITNHGTATAANAAGVKAQATINVPAHVTPTHKAAVTG